MRIYGATLVNFILITDFSCAFSLPFGQTDLTNFEIPADLRATLVVLKSLTDFGCAFFDFDSTPAAVQRVFLCGGFVLFWEGGCTNKQYSAANFVCGALKE